MAEKKTATRKLAEKIARDLFTSGDWERGNLLVLVREKRIGHAFESAFFLGMLNEETVASRIEAAILSASLPPKASKAGKAGKERAR